MSQDTSLLDTAVMELARLRDATDIRPSGVWQSRRGNRTRVPYATWRRAEGRYLRLDAWSKMIATVPQGGIRHHGRTWNWTSYLNGGRVQLRNSDWSSLVMIEGEVPPIGDRDAIPVDGIGHAPRTMLRTPGDYAPSATPRDTVPAREVRVTFPDFLARTQASPAPKRVIAEPYRHPLASVYRARHLAGWSAMPPLHQGMI
jgi:hypothetical protein